MSGGRGGRLPGTENYSSVDVDARLDQIERILPTGGNELDSVLENYQIYAERSGRSLRDVFSIIKKYQPLLNCPKPSGDPSCPAFVRRARKIQRAIAEGVEHDGNVDDGEDSEGNSSAHGPADGFDTPRNDEDYRSATESGNSAAENDANDREVAETFSFSLSLSAESPTINTNAGSRVVASDQTYAPTGTHLVSSLPLLPGIRHVTQHQLQFSNSTDSVRATALQLVKAIDALVLAHPRHLCRALVWAWSSICTHDTIE